MGFLLPFLFFLKPPVELFLSVEKIGLRLNDFLLKDIPLPFQGVFKYLFPPAGRFQILAFQTFLRPDGPSPGQVRLLLSRLLPVDPPLLGFGLLPVELLLLSLRLPFEKLLRL